MQFLKRAEGSSFSGWHSKMQWSQMFLRLGSAIFCSEILTRNGPLRCLRERKWCNPNTTFGMDKGGRNVTRVTRSCYAELDVFRFY